MYKLATAALAVALGISLSAIPAMSADDNKPLKDKAVDEKTKAKARETKDKIAAQTESSAEIRQAQLALKEKGHDPGPIDGIHGPRTSAALRAYQKAENIKVTGRLDADTKSHLMGQASGGATVPSASPAAPSPTTSGGSASAPAQGTEKTQKP